MTDVFNHPWKGGLFADPEVSDAIGPEAEIAAMLQVETAHARALGNDDAADAIAKAKIEPAELSAGMAQDGVPVPAFVRALKNQSDPALHAAIHKGLTSQDVVDTAQALMLRRVNGTFRSRIAVLAKELDNLRSIHGQETLMGRTRMQAALPIVVADRVDTWAIPLAGHLERLDLIEPDLMVLTAGGPVGVGLKSEHLTLMAQELGLSVPKKAGHVMRDAFVSYSNWLSLVSGTLGKMGQDIALMAQQGVDEVSLRGGGGSSAMPHKQNPVLAELLVSLARFNATLVGGMHQALVHEQERSGAAWTLEWMIMPQMVQATGRALSAAHTLIQQIERMGST